MSWEKNLKKVIENNDINGIKKFTLKQLTSPIADSDHALGYACMVGNAALIGQIIQQLGDKASDEVFHRGKDYYNPILRACVHQDSEVVTTLLNIVPLHLGNDNPFDSIYNDSEEEYPLLYKLVSNCDGNNVFHIICANYSKKMHIGILELIINKWPVSHFLLGKRNRDGDTPLHILVRNFGFDLPALQLILNTLGSNASEVIAKKNKQTLNTVLHEVCLYREADFVQLVACFLENKEFEVVMSWENSNFRLPEDIFERNPKNRDHLSITGLRKIICEKSKANSTAPTSSGAIIGLTKIKNELKKAADYFSDAQAKFKANRFQEAIVDFDKAIELNPQDDDYYYSRGEAKFNLDEYQAAIDDFNKAIQIDPQNAQYYSLRGFCKFILLEYQAAILDYDKSIQIDPQNAYYYKMRGVVKHRLQRYQAAVEDYNWAIELNPKDKAVVESRDEAMAAEELSKQRLSKEKQNNGRDAWFRWAYRTDKGVISKGTAVKVLNIKQPRSVLEVVRYECLLNGKEIQVVGDHLTFDKPTLDETARFKNQAVEASPLMSESVRTVIAIHKYTAQDATQLSFNADERMEVLREADGWLYCRLNSKEGWAPLNYLQKAEEVIRGESSSTVVTQSSSEVPLENRASAQSEHSNASNNRDSSNQPPGLIQNKTLSGHTDAVTSVALSQDGQTMVSGSQDNMVRVWRLSDGKELRRLQGHTGVVRSVALSQDGQIVVSGAFDYTVRVWSVSNGKELCKLLGHGDVVSSVSLSHDGQTVVSGSNDRTVRVFRVSDGKSLRKLEGHTSYVRSVALSQDGQTIVSGSDDKTVRVWRVSDGKELRKLVGHTKTVTSVSLSHDGQTVVSGSSDNTVRVWSVSDGKVLQILQGHTNFVKSVSLSHDGQTVVSGSSDKTVRVWRVSDGKELRKLQGHTDTVTSVALSHDGQMVVSGSEDKTVRVWVKTRKLTFQNQKQENAAREQPQKAQREAEQKFSNNLSELKQGYETGSLKPQEVIKRYAELLEEHKADQAKKELVIIARAEFNLFMANKVSNVTQKKTLLAGSKEDLEKIIQSNPFHEQASELLERIEKLMQQSNNPIASTDITAPSDSAPLPPSSQELAVPISDGSMKKTASLESSGLIELNLSIQYIELKFDKRLGQGAYGEVYSGTWRYNQVAIKKLLGTNYNEDAIRELQQEAQVLAKVRSDYVVQIKGLAIQSPHYCLVMELMPKGNLYELLQSEQPLGWTQRYQLAQDIGIGLHHLHAENILHRDLKSLNVLLSETGRAKLCDFGLAKIKTTTKTQSRMTQTNAGGEKSVGTLPWMAPELFGLRPKYSTKSDIYAYGIIMWELSARRVPYEDVASELEIRECIKQGEREEIPDNTPPSYAKLIKFCWAQKPEERPEVDEVLQTLEVCQKTDALRR